MTTGSSNGHGTPLTRKRLETLLAEHEANAQAIRTTLRLLDGAAAERKSKAVDLTVEAALAVDMARRSRATTGKATHGRRPTAKQPKFYTSKILKQRKASERMLGWFDTATPRRARNAGDKRLIGSMIRYGYLRHADEEGMYLRTEKPFDIQPAAPAPAAAG